MQKGRDLKPHIGIFGRRNTGKSSFINKIADQDIAIIADQPGTTTDPVKKSIEIFGVGPAIIIDTAGIDDTGELGLKRIQKSREVLKIIDMAILITCENIFGQHEIDLIGQFEKYKLPYIVLHNKSDIESLNIETKAKIALSTNNAPIDISCFDSEKLDIVFDLICKTIPETAYKKSSLLGDIIAAGDLVMLVTPIDSEAPEGRMILPQVMAIRDVLDNDCICVVVKETEIELFLSKTKIEPTLVITDSQAFKLVGELIPEHIPLTSFSIMLARAKSDFESYLKGTPRLSELKDNDCVLLFESCTHNVSCDDIGRFKIPKWLTSFSGRKLDFEVVSGFNQPKKDLLEYAIIIQCGGCVATEKQVLNRLKPAIEAGIPITNYGMAIAYMNGIFKRAVTPFLTNQK